MFLHNYGDSNYRTRPLSLIIRESGKRFIGILGSVAISKFGDTLYLERFGDNVLDTDPIHEHQIFKTSHDLAQGLRTLGLTASQLNLSFTDYTNKPVDYLPNVNSAEGCFLVIGESGSGKSTFMKGMFGGFNKSPNVSFNLVGEPVPHAMSVNDFLIELYSIAIARFSFGFDDRLVIGVDSFRELVYSAGGNALSGGISSGLLTCLTSISQLGYKCGICVVGVLNPMDITGDSDRVEALINTLDGACSGIIYDLDVIDFDLGVVRGRFKARLNNRREEVVTSTDLQKLFISKSLDTTINAVPPLEISKSEESYISEERIVLRGQPNEDAVLEAEQLLLTKDS